MKDRKPDSPLESIGEWDDDVLRRYPAEKKAQDFRDYEHASPGVREFYRLNHTQQSYAFAQEKRARFLPRQQRKMSVWQAVEFLNTLVDQSDPDTELSQIEHLLQTAEAIRRDGHPRWFILTGLIHDLGKILCLFGEPQWAVVGDTFPLGCQFSADIVFAEFFAENPDAQHPVYQTKYGVYTPGCGLKNVCMSWGHDEYLYHVVRDFLPAEGLAMIRYHSFYAAHRHGAYDYLMNEEDRELFRWVRAFNPYDLYTKSSQRPDIAALTPYYHELIADFFPDEIAW